MYRKTWGGEFLECLITVCRADIKTTQKPMFSHIEYKLIYLNGIWSMLNAHTSTMWCIHQYKCLAKFNYSKSWDLSTFSQFACFWHFLSAIIYLYGEVNFNIHTHIQLNFEHNQLISALILNGICDFFMWFFFEQLLSIVIFDVQFGYCFRF